MIARASPRLRSRPRILSRMAVPTNACNSSIVSKIACLFVDLGYEGRVIVDVEPDREVAVSIICLFQISFQNGSRCIAREREKSMHDPLGRNCPEGDLIADLAPQSF